MVLGGKAMKCPICGVEMQIGKIESNREIFWKADGEKIHNRISSRLFVKSDAYAERCAECGIIVLKEETN